MSNWQDTDESITAGCYVRRPDSKVVFLVEEIKNEWMSVVQVKKDGTRDKRVIGFSGSPRGYIVVEKATSKVSLYATAKDGEILIHQDDLKTISEMYNKIIKDIIQNKSPYTTARIQS